MTASDGRRNGRLWSFVAQARNEEPEVARVACVAPAETAADKLSALTWRVLEAGYNVFVREMCYGNETPKFRDALETARCLGRRLD